MEITVEDYGHPASHAPSIITQDANNRFVTDAQIAQWNAPGDASGFADAAEASAAAALVSENAAAASEVATGDDAVATGGDAVATAADRVQTGIDATAAGVSETVATSASIAAGVSETNAKASENQAEIYKDQAEAAALASALAFTTGDVKTTLKSVADAGWVMADDGTIGSAGSGATNRANADTESLYTLLWNNIIDTYAPVTGGRGASAAADFAADKPIQVGTMLGRVIGVAGAGAGLTARAIGEVFGAETHQLSISEIPNHTHTYDKTNTAAIGTTSGSANRAQPSFTSTNSGAKGGDGAHNNMQPTTFLTLMIKL
jgi:hypothetical protein